MAPDLLADLLGRYHFRFGTEKQLQAAISSALTEKGIDHAREVWLERSSIVDFMVGTTAIEVKTKGSLDAVTLQLYRYTHSPKVKAIILVTTRSMHDRLPTTIRNKPLRVVVLPGGLA